MPSVLAAHRPGAIGEAFTAILKGVNFAVTRQRHQHKDHDFHVTDHTLPKVGVNSVAACQPLPVD